jgi:L-alanine-DL-glutamate epimerase-like enolase superfamily enzyme
MSMIAVDMAAWDALASAAGVPLASCLGAASKGYTPMVNSIYNGKLVRGHLARQMMRHLLVTVVAGAALAAPIRRSRKSGAAS